MPVIRARTIVPKSGPLIEVSNADRVGMVRVQVVEEAEMTRKVHVIEAFFGSFLGEMNSGQSATPPMGHPLGRWAKVLKERGWVVIGSPSGEDYALLLFKTDTDAYISCDLPIMPMCRLVEHVATGAHHASLSD